MTHPPTDRRELVERLEGLIAAESADGNTDTIVSLRFLREIATSLALAPIDQPVAVKNFFDEEIAFYGRSKGCLDGIPFEHVAHVCHVMSKRLCERLAALQPAPAREGE